MRLYGWLVGRWEMDATFHREDGSIRHAQGEIHAGWTLAGRAIQDVWIVPRPDAPPTKPEFGDFYGTTLRIYDPGLDAWHILWNDPVKQYYTRQIGRAQGNDIVQEGSTDSGMRVRWRFVEIAPRSFRWLGEHDPDASGRWRLQTEFLARRVEA
jgi:hypothetical protein